MISEQDMGFYTRLAKGGVGYIVMGDVAPINSFSPTPKLFDDSQIPAFKALADSVHAYGTKLGVQLFHPEYDVDAINSLFMQEKFDEMRQRLHATMFFTDEVSEVMAVTSSRSEVPSATKVSAMTDSGTPSACAMRGAVPQW